MNFNCPVFRQVHVRTGPEPSPFGYLACRNLIVRREHFPIDLLGCIIQRIAICNQLSAKYYPCCWWAKFCTSQVVAHMCPPVASPPQDIIDTRFEQQLSGGRVMASGISVAQVGVSINGGTVLAGLQPQTWSSALAWFHHQFSWGRSWLWTSTATGGYTIYTRFWTNIVKKFYQWWTMGSSGDSLAAMIRI